MKKTLLLFLLCTALLLCSCNNATGQQQPAPDTEVQIPPAEQTIPPETVSDSSSNTQDPEENYEQLPCDFHTDEDDNGVCDDCSYSVIAVVDFYSINDLHGKIADSDTNPGVDELTTYFKNARSSDDHVIILSAGDMWQGTSESNLTGGLMMTEWMNEVGFAAMSMGNHEFDWGEDPVRANDEIAEFPFLAINIYDRETDERVSYCDSSVLVDLGDLQVGIIGAIGDCYSSIAPQQVEGIYFKTGAELTELVKDESRLLRSQGADFIVYMLHDGYEQSPSGSVTSVTRQKISSYYDSTLSRGYVDLVFEGHTHQRYLLRDEYGVYHLQNRGENRGISHVEVSINFANGRSRVLKTELLAASAYALLEDDPIVEELMQKYEDEISIATRVVGTNSKERARDTMRQLVADLYYQYGLEKWGDQYDIVLGGGFISIRNPSKLPAGEVTYGMLQELFPFDNELMLCSIRGSDLQYRFFESTHSSYFISYGEYGSNLRYNIDPNATYYVIVDSYSSSYAPNNLTVVEEYGDKIYARDLLAEYIENGGLN